MDTVIEVHNLNKKFCGDLKKSMLYGIKDIGREILNLERRSSVLRKKEFWALNDVSFSIQQGQSVGLIGANGAGKSTLLRILSGLVKPDAGSVKVRGRVAPLIALGAGFNPILTGRENIYVNMAILGLTTREIKERFDEVVDFSGLDHALDMPVQTYSSGMAARLGFSCAIFTHPDILLIDEVLAVGDIKFRAKCYRKLAELKELNTTFILVSHSPQSILSICDVGLYLKKGVLMGVGTTNEVMNQYEADLSNLEGNVSNAALASHISANPDFKIEKVLFEDEVGNELIELYSGKPSSLALKFMSAQPFDNLSFQIIVTDQGLNGERTLFLSNSLDQKKIRPEVGSNKLEIRFPFLGLNPGLYSLKIVVYQNELFLLDVIESFNFVVKSDYGSQQSLYYQPRNWILTKNET